jgi:hypothetical protein
VTNEGETAVILAVLKGHLKAAKTLADNFSQCDALMGLIKVRKLAEFSSA